MISSISSITNQYRHNSINKQQAFDDIAALADYFLSPIQTSDGDGGAFTDTSLTNPVTNHDEILGFKAIGTNPLSVTTLPFTGTPQLKSAALVWYKELNNGTHLVAEYIDRGNFDKFAAFRNGPISATYYETNPGSVSMSDPIDIIFALRYRNAVPYETMHFWKDEGGSIRFNASPALIGSAGFDPYIDCVVRVRIKSDGTWNMWKNGISIGSGTGANFSEIDDVMGTSSHVASHDFRYKAYKFGEFTNDELTTIYAKTQICFPWTVPSYPYVSNFWQGGGTAFDNTINGWRLGHGRTPVFTGGNGVAGTHLYRWFYYDANDSTLFPSSDGLLTNHRLVPATINLSTMDTGDNITAVMMDGVNIMTGTVTYTTSPSNTAALLVANINAAQSNFLAVQKGSVVRVHPLNNNYRPDVLTATVSGFSPTIITCPKVGYINCTTYGATGQIYDGHPSDSTIWVMCITIPRDSDGAEGEPIFFAWQNRNF